MDDAANLQSENSKYHKDNIFGSTVFEEWPPYWIFTAGVHFHHCSSWACHSVSV